MKILNENVEPYKLALRQLDQQLTYEQLSQEIKQVKVTLEQFGIRAGNIVMIVLPNSLDTVVLLLACLEMGVSPILFSSVRTIQIDPKKLDPKYVFTLKIHSLKETGMKFSEKYHVRNSIYMMQHLEHQHKVQLEKDTRLLVTSSGSTGDKKIIQLHEGGLYHNIEKNIKALGIHEQDVTLMVLPMGYSYGLVAQLLSHLFVGATVVFCNEMFFPLQQKEIIRFYDITSLFTTPIVLRKCVHQLHPSDSYAFKGLRYITIGGSFAESALIREAQSIYQCDIIKTYGLAEAGPRVSTNIISRN